MTRIFAILIRTAWIVLGYAAAAFAAGTVLAIAVLGLHAADLAEARPAFLFTLLMAGLMAGYWAFLPAIAVIAIGEFLQRRDWLFYSLGGGIGALFLLAWRENWASETEFALAAVAAGLAGGWAYWLVAGRKAISSPPSGS